MGYKLKLRPSAVKDLDKLAGKEVTRILNRLSLLIENPRPPGTTKLTNSDGYRISSGNYRILYEVNDSTQSIFIFRVKHRKDAYK